MEWASAATSGPNDTYGELGGDLWLSADSPPVLDGSELHFDFSLDLEDPPAVDNALSFTSTSTDNVTATPWTNQELESYLSSGTSVDQWASTTLDHPPVANHSDDMGAPLSATLIAEVSPEQAIETALLSWFASQSSIEAHKCLETDRVEESNTMSTAESTMGHAFGSTGHTIPYDAPPSEWNGTMAAILPSDLQVESRAIVNDASVPLSLPLDNDMVDAAEDEDLGRTDVAPTPGSNSSDCYDQESLFSSSDASEETRHAANRVAPSLFVEDPDGLRSDNYTQSSSQFEIPEGDKLDYSSYSSDGSMLFPQLGRLWEDGQMVTELGRRPLQAGIFSEFLSNRKSKSFRLGFRGKQRSYFRSQGFGSSGPRTGMSSTEVSLARRPIKLVLRVGGNRVSKNSTGETSYGPRRSSRLSDKSSGSG